MFWGRTDVYAKRGTKGGYFPQCNNRWNNRICPKQRGEKMGCEACEYTEWTKLEPKKIMDHLLGYREDGADVLGIYPLLADGTCRFLVFDFDNHEKGAESTDFANTDDEWHDEVDALRLICERNGITPLVERSRSGRGAHVWILFRKPIAASLARNFGFLLLDKGSSSINLKSFHYYDRMYPSQDVASSIGNLIALPLQGQALKNGNSAFVDKNWNAYPDQWDILLNHTKKLSIEEVEKCMAKWQAELTEKAGTPVSLSDWNRPKPWKTYGMVLMDECHHCGSNTSVEVMKKVNARYVYGVSATPKRGDELEKIIYMLIGSVRHSYTAKERVAEQGIGHYVYPRYTRVVDTEESKGDINGAYSLISSNAARNDMILEDTRKCVKEGRTPVILTKYKEQAKYLYDHLQKDADHVFLLYGDNSDKENLDVRRSLKEVPQDKSLILVATGQKIGEGFDYPRLDILMLAAPVSFSGRLEQYIGRLNRDYVGKEDVIVYDYIDSHIRILDNMYAKRLRTYKRTGFQVITNKILKKQTVNSIYDSGNYMDIFERDVVEAGKKIIVSSPELTQDKVTRFIYLVKPKQEAGVSVTVITTEPENISYGSPEFHQGLLKEMEESGIYVIVRDEVAEHFAVIDDELVWHGGMNLLGREDAWDNLMRIRSFPVAAELLEIVLVKG